MLLFNRKIVATKRVYKAKKQVLTRLASIKEQNKVPEAKTSLSLDVGKVVVDV